MKYEGHRLVPCLHPPRRHEGGATSRRLCSTIPPVSTTAQPPPTRHRGAQTRPAEAQWQECHHHDTFERINEGNLPAGVAVRTCPECSFALAYRLRLRQKVVFSSSDAYVITGLPAFNGMPKRHARQARTSRYMRLSRLRSRESAYLPPRPASLFARWFYDVR